MRRSGGRRQRLSFERRPASECAVYRQRSGSVPDRADSVPCAPLWFAVAPFMLVMILGRDHPGSLERRLAARPAHLERMQPLVAAGRVVLAGPLLSADAPDALPQGSLIVAEFDSVEAAQIWAEADPYVIAGVYASVEVRPFRKVLP